MLVGAAIAGIAMLAALVAVYWALYHAVREVQASSTLTCGATVLEVRHVLEKTGHTPLSFASVYTEIAPPRSPRPTPDGTRTNRMPGAWVDPAELPAHVLSGPLDPNDAAWMVYAPDAAHYACLAQNLPALRTALGPGRDDATEVVVWAGTADDVWPVFRAPDGITTLRVRRDGRIEHEVSRGGGLEAHTIGLVSRDASGGRIRAMTEDDPAVLSVAVDAGGRTLPERFPAAIAPIQPWNALRDAMPDVPLEQPTR